MPYRTAVRYLRWTTITVALGLALCAAVTLFFDPLGIFGSPRLEGFNATKPYLYHHQTLARLHAAKRICASAGIFGNSRAEIGFDPQHPVFASRGLDAFNHAIPGSGVAAARAQLQWTARAGCAPRVIVVGVEFFDFLGGTALADPVPGHSEKEPAIDLNALTQTVFSLDALRDSYMTLAAQRAPHAATISERGFNPLLNYLPEVALSGHYSLFRQRAEENLRSWARKPARIVPPGGAASADYRDLDEFLAVAQKSAPEIHLVIYPYHAQIRLMLARAGLSDLFTQWKASIVAAAHRTSSSESRVLVWDFSGLTEQTTERIPARADKGGRMTYYWEAGHFKKQLGDLVLDQVLSERPGPGLLLNAQSIDAWTAIDREQIRRLLSTPSPLLADVESMFEAQTRRH